MNSKKMKLIVGETKIDDVRDFAGGKYEVNNAVGGLTIRGGKFNMFCSEGYLLKFKKGVTFVPFDMFA